jgi:hypothetical protein
VVANGLAGDSGWAATSVITASSDTTPETWMVNDADEAEIAPSLDVTTHVYRAPRTASGMVNGEPGPLTDREGADGAEHVSV